MLYIEYRVSWKGDAPAFSSGAPYPSPKVYTSYLIKNHNCIHHAVLVPVPEDPFGYYNFYKKGTSIWGPREEKLKRVMLKDPD